MWSCCPTADRPNTAPALNLKFLQTRTAAAGAGGDLALTNATPSLATRNRDAKRRLMSVASDPWSRPTSCGATTDVGGPGQFRGLSFGEIGIPFRASGRARAAPVWQAPCRGVIPGTRHRTLAPPRSADRDRVRAGRRSLLALATKGPWRPLHPRSIHSLVARIGCVITSFSFPGRGDFFGRPR